MSSILVVEDTESLRDVLCAVLAAEGHQIKEAACAEDALRLIESDDFSLVLSDVKLPTMNGLELLQSAKAMKSEIPFVMMTAYGSIQTAVDAMKMGATDFITKPFDPQGLCDLLKDIIEHKRIIPGKPDSLSKAERTLVSQSPKIELLLKHAKKVAPLSSTVLILGESGTGKELLARYIHEQSTRAARAFVPINCASVPQELLESEFFGHEAGSFTGATEKRRGLFEVADQGTIFLDEIGSMPLALQVKLLRTLQDSEIRRVGGTKTMKVDTRVIAATNSDLEAEIRNGRFREDLYYRLGVVVLEIPPLRERREDISLLAKYFLKLYAAEFGKESPLLTPEAVRALERHQWPGNVRELENVIQRALIFSANEIRPEHLHLERIDEEQLLRSLPDLASAAAQEAETAAIVAVLAKTNGNKVRAARLLGVSYKTLLNKIRDYGIASLA